MDDMEQYLLISSSDVSEESESSSIVSNSSSSSSTSEYNKRKRFFSHQNRKKLMKKRKHHDSTSRSMERKKINEKIEYERHCHCWECQNRCFQCCKCKKRSSSEHKITNRQKNSRRNVRICPLPECGKSFVNVTNHRRHHPDVPKEVFMYDNMAKEKGLGKYRSYRGYKCCYCGIVVKFIVEHCKLKHGKEADVINCRFSYLKKRCNLKSKKLKQMIQKWHRRLQPAKEKQNYFVNEKNRRNLKNLPKPHRAIIEYEDKYGTDISFIRKKSMGAIEKKELETLYGNIFVRIIFRLGCRDGVLLGMKRNEYRSAELTEQGNYSILVGEHTEMNLHGCIVVSKTEYKDIGATSDHAYAFNNHKPGESSYMFPSLSRDDAKLEDSTFCKYFKKEARKAMGMEVSPTEVRKLITTKVCKLPVELQNAITTADGHSIETALKVCNVTHPMKAVEADRFAPTKAAEAERESDKDRPIDTTGEKSRNAELLQQSLSPPLLSDSEASNDEDDTSMDISFTRGNTSTIIEAKKLKKAEQEIPQQ